jgi:hypothetical protein
MANRFRAGEGPESPPRRAAGAVVLVVLVSHKPGTTSDEGCTDPSGGHPPPPTGSADQAAHVARTCGPIADAIGPPCKPGSLKTWSLLSCTRVPWRLAQEACACMHRPAHGRCITPRIYGPSADAEESTAEPQWATCPARARMRVCTVSLCAQRMRSRRRMPHVGGMHNQGVYASKASPSSVFIIWDRLLLVLAKQLQAEEAPHKTLIMRILALKLTF